MRFSYTNEICLNDFIVGFKAQTRILHTLMIRELMMRYGRGNIGFMWLVLEPMILCCGVVALRWLIQDHTEHGVSLVAMVLSGYMPLTLWRHMTQRATFLLRRNVGLLFHRNISVLDSFTMTMALEFCGCTVAFIVNYFIFLLLGLLDPINDYGLVLTGWCIMGVLSASFGLLTAVLTEKYEIMEKFIVPVQYLLVPISGFLFMVDWLPTYAQEIIWYMPLTHCYEIMRDGFFGRAVQAHYSMLYPIAISLAITSYFLPQLDTARDHLKYG